MSDWPPSILRLMMGAIAVGIVLSCVTPSVGEAQTVPEATAPFEALELSARLARLGQAQDDPWLLATAARIRLMMSVPPDPGTPTRSEGTAASWPDSARAWLSEAETLAEGDAEATAYIARIRDMVQKGRVPGPSVSLSRLGSGQTHRYRERFAPGQAAVIYVEGDGDTPLLLRVSAADGVACYDARPGDIKLCAWTAKAPGVYNVEVRNLGRVANRYAYGTN